MLRFTKAESNVMPSRQILAVSNTSINVPEIRKRTSSLPDLVVRVHGKGKRRLSRTLSEADPKERKEPLQESKQRTMKYRPVSLDSVKEEFESRNITSLVSQKAFSKGQAWELPPIVKPSSKILSKSPSTESARRKSSSGSLSNAQSKESVSNTADVYVSKEGQNKMVMLTTIPMAIKKFKKNIEANNLKQKPTTVRRSNVTGWRRIHMVIRQNHLNEHKFVFQKKMIRKFRLAVKLCIYCIRLIKAHSLR